MRKPVLSIQAESAIDQGSNKAAISLAITQYQPVIASWNDHEEKNMLSKRGLHRAMIFFCANVWLKNRLKKIGGKVASNYDFAESEITQEESISPAPNKNLLLSWVNDQ